ncbi:MAG: prepilin-type N-terminal cleavage/methylation domain-containing protein [Planctomycetes bacterium]|nr:prepilin-type N-terminal cleavage/methylation domain-containing protein [Planctomycetota bacterium]
MQAMERKAGFTLIETVVVIAIIGIFMTVVVPSLENVSPVYRLRSAARLIAAEIEASRTWAISKGKPYALHYDINERRFWMIWPPKPEDPDAPLEYRPKAPAVDLPTGVDIQEIVFPDGTSVTIGAVDIIFDQLGTEGSHIVVISNEARGGGTMSVKFNAVTGIIDFHPGVARFEEYL